MTVGVGQPPPSPRVIMDRVAIPTKVAPMMIGLMSLVLFPPGSGFSFKGFVLAVTCNLHHTSCAYLRTVLLTLSTREGIFKAGMASS